MVVLDTVRKDTNKSEWRHVNRASTTLPDGTYLEEVGDGYILNKLLRVLLENKVPISAYIEVRRGDTPTFRPMPLFRWLGLGPDGEKIDNRPEQLKVR